MPKLNLIEIINNPEVDRVLDVRAFEKYCSACDRFETDDCPHRGGVDLDTEWELINCKGFWD